MDKQDRELLSIMQKDAGLSVGHLAEQIGMSKSACWRRIRKLESEGVIRQKVTLLDHKKIGLPVTAYISVKTNQHNEAWAKRFNSTVEGMADVIGVYRLSGNIDYLIKIAVPNIEAYDRLYSQLIQIELFDVNCSFVMETIKETTILPLDYL